VARPLAEKAGLVLGAQYAAHLPRIVADELSLKQMLLNLLANAIKFNRPEGEVRVRVTHNEDGRIAVVISDTGVGIPSQDLPRIFERFYRVDKARSRESGGTGLGLAIAKHIMLAHSGTIHAESELNHGSIFLFTLPAAVPA
jgi:two-component system phosphate regulon sensor histidine kinase PhoR